MTLYTDLKDEINEHLFGATDPDTPTEAALFRPNGGSNRTIRVFVERDQAEPYGNARAGVLRFTALNDATLGIDTDTVDLGRDQIDLSERVGVAAKTRQLHKIVSHTATHVTIEVR